MERQQLDAFLVDLDVVGVDLAVALDDLPGEGVIALEERRHHPADLVLDEPSHGQEGLLQPFQLLVKVPRHGVAPSYPNRPVM